MQRHILRERRTNVMFARKSNMCSLMKIYFHYYFLGIVFLLGTDSLSHQEIMHFFIRSSRFKLRTSLTVHKYLHREKDYLCDQCDYRTYAMHMLKAHKAIHSEKLFECEFCGKRFAQAGALKVCSFICFGAGGGGGGSCRRSGPSHGLKQLSWTLNTSLTNKSSNPWTIFYPIQIHRRIHTGEKPFGCTLCEYRTVCGANLNAHTMQVHKVRYYKQKETQIKKENAANDDSWGEAADGHHAPKWRSPWNYGVHVISMKSWIIFDPSGRRRQHFQ